MNIDSLKYEWRALAEMYYDDKNLVNFYWEQILKKYSGKKRLYHNLNHIQKMLNQAKEYKVQIVNYDEVLFAIWFHDIIYKSTSKTNEEKSALFARSALQKVKTKNLKIDKICQLIISTKTHNIILKENNDNAFMLDFDLSILGQEWIIYEKYIQNIRKEYSIYPDFLYKPGRKKFLQNFLKRKNLFFTDGYKTLYEVKARENLLKEVKVY